MVASSALIPRNGGNLYTGHTAPREGCEHGCSDGKVGERSSGGGGGDPVGVSSNVVALETGHRRGGGSDQGALSLTAGAWSPGGVSGGAPGVGCSVFWGLRTNGCWVPALTRLSLRAWRRILAVGCLPFQGQGDEPGTLGHVC